MSLDPQAREFLDAVAASNRPPIESIPLAEARALFEDTFIRLAGQPVEVGSVADLAAPGPRGPVPVRVYRPHGALVPPPLLVFVHGGGFVCGSRAS